MIRKAFDGGEKKETQNACGTYLTMSCSEVLWLLLCMCLFLFQQPCQRQFSKGEKLLKLTLAAHNPSLKEATRTQGRNN